jgi:glycosyltransferase involved in cell wall biosynthesis
MREPSSARPRILIEASKLADGPMDGIKRYVVELLRAFAAAGVGERLEVEVMVLDRVYALSELPARFLGSEDGQQGDGIGGGAEEPFGDLIHRILRALGALIPPILLYPIRWLLPAWAARRFLGKEKSELRVPRVDPSGRNLPALLLPPIVVSFIDWAIPERVRMYLWTRGILQPAPRSVDLSTYDLVHLTLPNNHHYLEATQIPMLVTVHDLCHFACPEHQTRANRFTLSAGLSRAIDGGASFATVSRAGRAQMLRFYGLEPSRVVAVHSGCDEQRFHPVRDPQARARARRKYRIPESRFLLTLCTIEPRKNLLGTLRAFELLIQQQDEPDLILVIAGKKGWKSRQVMRAAARNPARVHLTGYIEDADLAAVYSAATGFVYASHYEGFGFPLLEAMRCGTPVIYGNNSSMPEIVADAGLPVDPEDPLDMARQMRRLLSDHDLATTLGKRAIDRAGCFSWERTAARTLDLYDEMLSREPTQ